MRKALAVLLLFATSVVLPLVVLADQLGGMKRIGILYQDPMFISRIDAFRDKLRELGYVQGRTVQYEYRIAGADDPQIAATNLVRSGVDLIVAPGTQVALGAKRATTKVPIVFYGADPVGTGLVASLAQPGGNATGLASLGDETGAKRLELLRELLPGATRVAVLVNPDNPSSDAQQRVVEASAHRLGLKLHVTSVRSRSDIGGALSSINRKHVDALIILPDVFLMAHNVQIAEYALKARVPSVFAYRMFPDAGGLMSYGPDFDAVWQRCAIYADKILKGATPAELPVEQPTKFELIVNLKTAKALGITIPESVLLRADEVIR